MKKSPALLLPVILAVLLACNSNGHSGHADTQEPAGVTDTLEKQIDDLHIVGMSKMGQLTRFQQQTKQLIDSIAKLPAKAKKAAAPYKQQLDSLKAELDYAEFAMNKWMADFYKEKKDTVVNSIQERVNYLVSEKQTINTIKERILGGLKKADSLLK